MIYREKKVYELDADGNRDTELQTAELLCEGDKFRITVGFGRRRFGIYRTDDEYLANAFFDKIYDGVYSSKPYNIAEKDYRTDKNGD